ncbi:MAG: hypothetical protein H7Z43_08400, partial [Clostridia bacterium]|nr:hypothetical protein [Deltaproteobacteria bacterium]
MNISSCGDDDGPLPGISGPADASVNQLVHRVGDAERGQDVFRFETFGNEGFWTQLVQLPQGIAAAGVTPAQALALGLSVDIERVPQNLRATVEAEAATDLSQARAPNLNNPAITAALVEANAIIGFSARNVVALNGSIDISPDDVYAGESVGATCALCHAITDGSVLDLASGGSIGRRVDGPTNHHLNYGAIVATALNSRALYPTLALRLAANNGMSLSRLGPGQRLVSAEATEIEVDAYLRDA